MKTILLLSERFAVPVTVSLAPGRLALKEGRRPALAKDGATWLRLCPRVTEHSLHRPPHFGVHGSLGGGEVPWAGVTALSLIVPFALSSNLPLPLLLQGSAPSSNSPKGALLLLLLFFNFYFSFSVDIRYHFGSRCTASSQTFAHFSEAGPCGGAAWPAPGRSG